MFSSAIRAAKPTAQRFASQTASKETAAAADPYAHKSLLWKLANPRNKMIMRQRQFQAEKAAGIPTHLMGNGKYYYPMMKWATFGTSGVSVYFLYQLVNNSK